MSMRPISVGLGILFLFITLVDFGWFSLLGGTSETLFGIAAIFALMGILLLANGLRSSSGGSLQGFSDRKAGAQIIREMREKEVKSQTSALERSILQELIQKKSPQDIANATGVSLDLVSSRITGLKVDGFLTESQLLTEKGFEAAKGNSR
jgi:hypothetical protein